MSVESLLQEVTSPYFFKGTKITFPLARNLVCFIDCLSPSVVPGREIWIRTVKSEVILID